MATRGIRINKARNFAGKAYLTEVTSGNAAIVISNNSSVSLKLNTDAETSKYLAISNGGLTVNSITTAIDTAKSNAITSANNALSAVVGYSSLPSGSKTVDSRLTSIEDTLSTLSGGAVMGINSGTGISVTSGAGGIYTVGVDGTVARSVTATNTISGSITNGALSLNTRLTLAKKTTATTGYAATYELQDGAGNKIGDEINILKDQFLKAASLVWGTAAALTTSGTVTGESATKSSSAKYPFLKLEVYTNDNGSSTDDTVVATVYIPVKDLFHDVAAGTGISVEQTSAGNVVSLDTAYLNSHYQASGSYLSTFTGTNDYVPQITSNGGALKNGRAIVTTITSGGTSLPTDGAVYNAVDTLRTKFNNGGLYTISSATVNITAGMTTLSTTLADVTTKEGVYKVLDGKGDVIYPEIQSYAGSGAVIEADFGTGATEAETWTVYYFKAVTLS